MAELLDETSWTGNPQLDTPTPTPQAQPEAPQQQAATQWVLVSSGTPQGGRGDGQAEVEQRRKDQPELQEQTGTVDSTVDAEEEQDAMDNAISKANPQQVANTVANNGGTTKEASAAARIVGPASSLQDVRENWKKELKAAKGEQFSMGLMFMGLGLLSGQGFNGAMQAMKVGMSFNQDTTDRINERLSRLDKWEDKVASASMEDSLKISQLTAAFKNNQIDEETFSRAITKVISGIDPSAGQTGSIGWRGTDNKVYFQRGNKWVDSNGQPKPQNVDITDKVGTHEGKLSTTAQKSIRDSQDVINDASFELAEATNIVANAPTDPAFWESGVFGQGIDGVKKFLGGQDELSVWRTQVKKITNNIAISSLPKGPASDRDIALARDGVLNGFANPAALNLWLASIERLNNYRIRYHTDLRDYINENGNSAGFEPPPYQPQGADQATNTTVTGGGEDNSGVDLDLTDL